MAESIRIIQKKGAVNRQINDSIKNAMKLIMENRKKAEILKAESKLEETTVA
mgnify:CR=1 FL=1